MSKSTQRYSTDEEFVSYQPKTQTKSVVITRSNRTNPRGSGMYGGTMSMRASMGGGGMINPAVVQQLSKSGITDFKGSREREKRDMQDLNERLADYIQKVHFLGAENKKLLAELEALRGRKQEDWKPIRAMYEGELEQARKVIQELSAQKGVSDAKMAAFQDEIASLKDLIAQLEANNKDYCKKIDQLNSQIGEYEGEITTLRMRCASLEDELAKLRDMLNKLKDENSRLRADLDTETQCHIEQEVLAQTKSEECDFLNELLNQLKLMEPEPIKIKGVNAEEFYKQELKNAIRDLTLAYEDKQETMAMELDAKYCSQLEQLRSGNVRDTLESEHAKTEVKRLRDQLSERNKRIAELEQELASIRADRDCLRRDFSEMENEYQRQIADFQRKVTDLQAQVETLLAQIGSLMDAKISLEMEIACYKKLLEGEESRVGLRTMVEQTIGSQGRGASALSDMIGQSSLSSSTTARTTVQRTSKGAVSFQGCDPAGGHVVIENTTSGSRAKPQNLKGTRLVKKVGGKKLIDFPLPDKVLNPGQTLKVFAQGAKSSTNNPNECICDVFSLGTGDGVYEFCDETGEVKASMKLTTVQ